MTKNDSQNTFTDCCEIAVPGGLTIDFSSSPTISNKKVAVNPSHELTLLNTVDPNLHIVTDYRKWRGAEIKQKTVEFDKNKVVA